MNVPETGAAVKRRPRTLAGRYWAMEAESWPTTVPPLSEAEAKKATRLLWHRFYHKRFYEERNQKPPKARPLVVKINPHRKYAYMRNRLIEIAWPAQGWKTMVHSLSHRFHARLRPYDKGHGDNHRALEREMIEHVVKNGWLEGKLKR